MSLWISVGETVSRADFEHNLAIRLEDLDIASRGMYAVRGGPVIQGMLPARFHEGCLLDV